MNRKRLAALSLLPALCITILAGCGTSRNSSMEESIEEGSWEELTLPSASTHPSADIVIPELDLASSYDEGEDVTAEYKNIFLGTWDNEDGTKTYEFRGNENLIITDSSGSSKTYTYWLIDVGSQVRLCIFENGQEEAVAYTFTMNGNNLTLYDLNTGNAVDLLTRRVTVQESPASSKTPSGTATPTQTPAPTQTPPSPSPSPSAIPSPSPSPSPSVSPSPSPSAEPDLPPEVQHAIPAIECALDVIRSGGSFSSTDADSFWGIMARFAARSGYSTEDGYTILTPEEMLSCAQQVFAGLDTLPEVPEGSSMVIHDPEDASTGTPERYRLLQGELSGIDIASMEYDGEGTLTVAVRDDGNAFDYEIVLEGSAIRSITSK